MIDYQKNYQQSIDPHAGGSFIGHSSEGTPATAPKAPSSDDGAEPLKRRKQLTQPSHDGRYTERWRPPTQEPTEEAEPVQDEPTEPTTDVTAFAAFIGSLTDEQKQQLRELLT